MKKAAAIILLLALLLLPACGAEQAPKEAIFQLEFWQMDEPTLRKTLLSQGWEPLDFPEHGITFYLGQVLGRPSYLRAEFSAETGFATALHAMTKQYPRAMQEAWEKRLERDPDYMYGRPWTYYEDAAEVTMAHWLSEAKAAVHSAGGTIAEEGTCRLSGATPEEMQRIVADALGRRWPTVEYGEQFYRLPNGLYCSYYAAAQLGWSDMHVFEPYPMFDCRIFLCTEDYEVTDYHWRWGQILAPQRETYETAVDQPTQLATMTA